MFHFHTTVFVVLILLHFIVLKCDLLNAIHKILGQDYCIESPIKSTQIYEFSAFVNVDVVELIRRNSLFLQKIFDIVIFENLSAVTKMCSQRHKQWPNLIRCLAPISYFCDFIFKFGWFLNFFLRFLIFNQVVAIL